MAEQLNKNDYLNHPDKIGALNYYSLGETTIKQLQQNNIINSKTKKFQAKKPDALITDDKKEVIAYIENKDIGKLDTEKDIESAFKQEIDVAKAVKAHIFIITDTKKSYYYNVLTGERILDEEGNELRSIFKPNENKKALEKLIYKIMISISKENNQIKKIEYLDPTDLATAIHQKIWIAKNSSPETCLYTFVELFIFKYLSDLKVLKGNYSFDFLYNMYQDENNSEEEILAFYLGETGPRERIKTLFPAGDDGTTVVNGDVFHAIKDKSGEYVVSGDGKTFRLVIEEFKKYENKHGKFINIDKDFKSKLFECFLKNEKDKKKMGQFFTPLKVVEQINRMIEIKDGMEICDPACGVGKFLLEAIASDIDNIYKFNGDELKAKISLHGFDKYSEDNSDRTIILAKANMLIYLSKLIAENPSAKHTKKIAELFNKSFILKRSNLGTLEELETEKYDLILTNPPYVVNGSADIKLIANATGNYECKGLGLEALFMEWIVKSLKVNGTALIVVPDGILSNKANSKLREYIFNKCIIDGIISLPINTFFGTPKKTYILSLKKKVEDEIGNTNEQINPVFSYICNSIGETLDIYRFDCDDNHLEQAVNQYRLFQASSDKNKFKAVIYDEDGNPYIDGKCKLISIKDIKDKIETSWVIDNYWTDEEKVKLGFKDESNIMSIEELQDLIDIIVTDMNEYKEELVCLI
ncbi:HsdM family class I SAM-dependent methyltransferase [Clostridium botulinum]|uniref:HsdM family class I SAM-dependent methyltransferase n=1 Tax=Clostridium botulinum TaxID=1491 RepID=UPI001967C932|nr:N-6 DNA methylase [Clostridium botulinum]